MKISSKFKTKVPKLNLKKQGDNIDARSDTLFCPDNENNNNDNSCIDVKNVKFSESLANKLNKHESNQNQSSMTNKEESTSQETSMVINRTNECPNIFQQINIDEQQSSNSLNINKFKLVQSNQETSSNRFSGSIFKEDTENNDCNSNLN